MILVQNIHQLQSLKNNLDWQRPVKQTIKRVKHTHKKYHVTTSKVTYEGKSSQTGLGWSCVFHTDLENWWGLREASGAGYHYHIYGHKKQIAALEGKQKQGTNMSTNKVIQMRFYFLTDLVKLNLLNQSCIMYSSDMVG